MQRNNSLLYLKEPMTIVWKSPVPVACDICKAPITKEFFDARTHSGRWGNLCRACFNLHTTQKLGIGYAQHFVKYEQVWSKV